MKNAYFLKRVAQRALKLQEEHHRVAVVFPNQRAGIYLKKHMAQLISKPILAPSILTLEELLNDISENIRLDMLTQVIELYRAYTEVDMGQREKDRFDTFLNWATTFIKDCNDIDNAVEDPDEFFKKLYEDKEIRNWSLSQEPTELQQDYLNFWKHAKDLYDNFTERLSKKGGGYMGYNYKAALKKLNSGAQVPYDYILIAGFNAMTVAEERAVDTLIADGRGEVFWDMDAYYAGADKTIFQAGKYYRKYIDRWPITEPLNGIIGYNNTDISIWESPNKTAQCDIVFKLLNDKIASGEIEDLSSIAIILSDENLLETLLLRLPESISNYNITMGKPLRSFALFHFFDKIMNVFQEVNHIGYTSESLINLASTSSARVLDENGDFEKLRKHLFQNNIFRLKYEEYNEKLTQGFWNDLSKVNHKDIIHIIEFIEDCIQNLRFRSYDEEDNQTVEVLFEFHNIFTQLKNLAESNSDIIEIGSIRRLYKTLCSQTRIPFEGEPINGVQIMGLLESRLLDFEHVILVSANEGIVPENKSNQSFIPHVFKRFYKMPTYDERDAIFAYSFYRLLHHPAKMDIIYDGSVGSGVGSSEKSRYVQQLEAEYLDQVNYDVSLNSASFTFDSKPNESREYIIEKTPEVLQEIRNYLVKGKLSASSINTLVKSPLEFYLKQIKGYTDPQLLESQIEANTFGSIVHDTLQELYEKVIHKPLDEQKIKGLKSQLEEKLIAQFNKHVNEIDYLYGYNRLMYNASKKMVEQVIALDNQRIKDHTIVVKELENELKVPMSLNYDGEEKIIHIRGFIDRVQSRDDVIEIIDYKTGNVEKLGSKNLSNISQDYKQDKLLQLTTYAFLLSHRKEDAYNLSTLRPALFGLKSWQNGLTYIDDDPNFVITPEHIETFKSNLTERITELLDPEIPFTVESESDRIKYSNFLDVWNVEVSGNF